jgi:transcriptional regulator with XRE-family HTH domain
MTGHELRAIRMSRGLSRPALAELAGVHPDTVRYWERKERVDVYGFAPARMLGAMKVKARHKRKMARPRHGVLVAIDTIPPQEMQAEPAFAAEEYCGAKIRKGLPCKAKPLQRKRRCKLHGGLSTGPRTFEGRTIIAEAQRRRWAANR